MGRESKYSVEQKVEAVKDYKTEIDNLFYRIITRELDSLENDIQPIS